MKSFSDPGTGPRASADELFDRVFVPLETPLSDEAAFHAVLAADGPGSEAVPDRLQAFGFSARQQGRYWVARKVVRDWLAQPTFHPRLRTCLQSRAAGLLAQAVGANNWLGQRAHPVNELLACLGELAPGWYPGHPLAEELQTRMQGWLDSLAAGQAAETVRAEARQWTDRFHQRVDKLCERVRQAEEGSLRLDYARRRSASVIQHQLAGRPLPDTLAADLREQWWPALEWILLNQGEDSTLWNRAVKTLTLLFWSAQPELAEEQQQRKLQRISGDLQGQVRDLLAASIADEQVRTRMFDTIQVIHASLLQGRRLSYVEVTEPASGSLVEDSGATISQDLLSEMERLSTQDWFECAESGERMRLLIRQDEYQQLLFVSQAGARVLSTSFEDFAWRLTSRQAEVVTRSVTARELVVECLEALAAFYRHQRARARQQEQPQPETPATGPAVPQPVPEPEAAPETVPESEPWPVDPASEPEANDDTVQGTPDADRDADPNARQRARLLVSGLPLGSWLDFRDSDGSTRRLKLTLVMSSSDKYVFVSRNGLDRREIPRRDLIDGIAHERISMLNNDSRYNDTLSRVVDGLHQGGNRIG